MDDGEVARADLRSYALRRCIRFYAAMGMGAIFLAAMAISIRPEQVGGAALVLAALFGILAAVELGSGVVMLEMALVRSRHPGPETPLWRFAQGPHPSWVAAVLYAAVAVLLLLIGMAD